VGAGVFFLVTLETRIKRRRALTAIRELRAIAHIIDMHQLTKDPEWIVTPGKESAPAAGPGPDAVRAVAVPRLLQRDAVDHGQDRRLYIQDFDDDVALSAVNEVENLTTGLSRKIWQKLMIVYAMGPET
jgi:hypothetical protein